MKCPQCGGSVQSVGANIAFCLECEWDNMPQLDASGLSVDGDSPGGLAERLLGEGVSSHGTIVMRGALLTTVTLASLSHGTLSFTYEPVEVIATGADADALIASDVRYEVDGVEIPSMESEDYQLSVGDDDSGENAIEDNGNQDERAAQRANRLDRLIDASIRLIRSETRQ